MSENRKEVPSVYKDKLETRLQTWFGLQEEKKKSLKKLKEINQKITKIKAEDKHLMTALGEINRLESLEVEALEKEETKFGEESHEPKKPPAKKRKQGDESSSTGSKGRLSAAMKRSGPEPIDKSVQPGKK
jgi:hypothetical protein